MRIVNYLNNMRLLAAALLLGLATPAGAQVTPYSAGVVWESGPANFSLDVAVGDIDLDGRLDVIFANLSQPNTLFLGNGRLFEGVSTWDVGSGRGASIAVGDIDGDGDLDVVVGTDDVNLLYLNNDGELATTPAWTSVRTVTTRDVLLGDVDNDGVLDLVCADDSDGASYCRGLGGAFAEPPAWTVTTTGSIVGVALGDIDGNGTLDLVCANSSPAATNAVYLNSGISFADTSAWTPDASRQTMAVALGDMNGDGMLDVVCANELQANEYFLNVGNGFGVTPAWASTPTNDSRSVVLGDVFGDGSLAMVFGNNGANACYVATSANPVWTSGRDNVTFAVALVDTDADGFLDVVCANAGQTNTLYENAVAVFDRDISWSARAGNVPLGVAIADVDGDGVVEFATGNDGANELYRPDISGGSGLYGDPVWQSSAAVTTTSVAFGDMNGDGTPDLVCGNTSTNAIYYNVGGQLDTLRGWISSQANPTTGVAVGDIDGDGRLDLVCSNASGNNTIYFNSDAGLRSSPGWAVTSDAATEVALGDIDGDGDLDLVFSNTNTTSNTCYENIGGVVSTTPLWVSGPANTTSSVALGDIDGDGDLDVAFGNVGEANSLYLNNGSTFALAPAWSSSPTNATNCVAFADIDGDGDLDLLFGNSTTQPSTVPAHTAYINDGGTLRPTPDWAVTFPASSISTVDDIALADFDRDGDLDLVAAAQNITSLIFAGRTNPPFRRSLLVPTYYQPNNAAFVSRVDITDAGTNLRMLEVTVADAESDPVWLYVEHQFLGQHQWIPADVGVGGVVGPLATAPVGIPFSVPWDVSRLAFDSREVVLRVRAGEVPGRVSVLQYAPSYVTNVGAIEPSRPEIASSPGALAFPTVTVGDTVTLDIRVSNTGNANLEPSAVVLPSSEMWLSTTALPEIPPGESYVIGVNLSPVQELDIGGYIEIASNDPLTPVDSVAITSDIRALEVTSRLLTARPSIPLGEAATVIVEPLPGVRVESGSLFSRSVGEATFREIPLGRSGGDFVGLIPGASVSESGIEYYVEVRNSSVVNTDPPGAPSAALFFQAVDSPSTVASAPRPTSGDDFLRGASIRVDVALPQGAQFQRGTLYYREGGTTVFGSRPIVVGDDGVPASFIPADTVGARGVDYFVEVQTLTKTLFDPAGEPPRPHSIPVLILDLLEPSSHAGQAYRLFSVPLAMRGSILGAVADELGGIDNTQWRLWGYDASGYRELPRVGETDFVQGKGYWLISRESHRIGTGADEGATTPTNAAFPISLPPGYTLVANPFTFDVAWDEFLVDTLSVTDPLVDGLLEPPVGYVPGNGYVFDVDVLKPFDAYWVLNRTALTVTLYVPPREAGAAGAAASARREPSGWRLSVAVVVAGATGTAAEVGVDADAGDAWDTMDRSRPPLAPGKSAGVYAANFDWEVHPGAYARDLRSEENAEGSVWRLDVDKSFADASAGDEVTIIVRGVDALPWNDRIVFVDRRLDRVIDLRERDDYRFYLGVRKPVTHPDEARFALVVGTDAFVEQKVKALSNLPDITALHQNHPNPFNPSTVVRYDLAEPGHVSLRVYDVRGALVRVLEDNDRGRGRYEVGWNGDNDQGTRVASGVYFYRLVTGRFASTRKMVLLK